MTRRTYTHITPSLPTDFIQLVCISLIALPVETFFLPYESCLHYTIGRSRSHTVPVAHCDWPAGDHKGDSETNRSYSETSTHSSARQSWNQENRKKQCPSPVNDQWPVHVLGVSIPIWSSDDTVFCFAQDSLMGAQKNSVSVCGAICWNNLLLGALRMIWLTQSWADQHEYLCRCLGNERVWETTTLMIEAHLTTSTAQYDQSLISSSLSVPVDGVSDLKTWFKGLFYSKTCIHVTSTKEWFCTAFLQLQSP